MIYTRLEDLFVNKFKLAVAYQSKELKGRNEYSRNNYSIGYFLLLQSLEFLLKYRDPPWVITEKMVMARFDSVMERLGEMG